MLLLLALLLLAPTHSLGAAPPAANAACDAACQAAQRAALVRLYAAWGGARWVRSHSWNSTGSVCNWSGVVCCVDGSKITEALAFDGDVVGVVLAPEDRAERATAYADADFQLAEANVEYRRALLERLPPQCDTCKSVLSV